MKITYLGHSCLLAESGETKVLIDPFLTGNPKAAVKPEQLHPNAIVLTHGHGDHFADALQIAKANDCPIIATFELATYCRMKGAKAHEMNTGGAHQFDGFKVKFTQAFHSSSIIEEDKMIYAGMPNGVILTMDGKTLFHAGDTALFSDLKMIGERNAIDIAVLPIGDNFTMGPEDAATAAKWLGVREVLPVHYNTFPLIEQDPAAFAELLRKDSIRCHPLQPGESVEI